MRKSSANNENLYRRWCYLAWHTLQPEWLLVYHPLVPLTSKVTCHRARIGKIRYVPLTGRTGNCAFLVFESSRRICRSRSHLHLSQSNTKSNNPLIRALLLDKVDCCIGQIERAQKALRSRRMHDDDDNNATYVQSD